MELKHQFQLISKETLASIRRRIQTASKSRKAKARQPSSGKQRFAAVQVPVLAPLWAPQLVQLPAPDAELVVAPGREQPLVADWESQTWLCAKDAT
jgi:hypothetical protein